MIPIRDLNASRTKPVVTYVLIAINVVVWLLEVFVRASQGDDGLQEFIWRHGLVPGMLLPPASLAAFGTLLTHMFVHGGWAHVIGNMWFLHIFGNNVEDRLGKGRFLAFYLLCGFAAALGQIAIQALMSPSGAADCLASGFMKDPRCVPMVGASGAIAGVLAGYVTLFPRARVLTLIPIFVFIQFAEIRAWFFIVFWFIYQIVMGFTSLGVGAGVAFFAHIGGFLAGLVLVRLFTLGTSSSAPMQPSPRIVFEEIDDE